MEQNKKKTENTDIKKADVKEVFNRVLKKLKSK